MRDTEAILRMSRGPEGECPRTPVLDQFRRACDLTPDAVALHCGGTAVSYRALDEMVSALALRLRAERVGNAERVVPLLFDGGPELVVAILACMEVGQTFVPLDTQWPEDRIRDLLQGLDADTVLTCNRDVPLARQLGFQALDVRCADRAPRAADMRSLDERLRHITYGYFTSGSTGRPKCALNRELGLVNRFAVMTRRFHLGAGACVLQNSRHVFDSALWQILWPLTVGATVVLPVGRQGLDLDATIDLIAAHGVVMTDFVPSIFNLLVERMRLDARARAAMQSFRHVLVGGEAINAKSVAAFLEMVPGATVVNTYGPTEAAIGMVFHEVDRHTPAAAEIPLGRPIDNTALVVLDELGKIVPVGTPGEAYVAGIGVGVGYLNQPDVTAKAFLPNPFPQIAGDTLYKTGDLVHWDEDGLLWFHGRLDEQLKVDGIRVEPGEIERALLGHPSVSEVKVAIHGEGTASKRLVAFVVGERVDIEQLKQYAATRLPKSLVPGEILCVAAMPLNHNGKLDRKQLDALLMARRGDSVSAEAPQGWLEERVADIFCRLLGVHQVGRTDSFLKLGGTSLLTVQALLSFQAELGMELHGRRFALDPTVAGVAKALQGADCAAGVHVSAPEQVHEQLPDEVRRPNNASGPIEAVMLTGSTGFIGVHLLEALSQTVKVRCLVRARDEAEAWRRLHLVMGRYRVRPQLSNVEVICGDLSRGGRLGLDSGSYDALARQTDAVVHAAGEVNFIGDYEHHRPVNVQGTVEALKFAAAARNSRFLHVGSASGKANEAMPTSGYDRSKWVAERLVLEAAERGLEASVYHVGEAMPHTQRGLANERALAHALLQSGVALGVFPLSFAEIDYAPVDHIAETIARSCLTAGRAPACNDLRWPWKTTFADVIVLLASAGLPLRFVSSSSFLERLQRACAVRNPAQEVLVAYTLLREQSEQTQDLLATHFTQTVPAPVHDTRGDGFETFGVEIAPVDARSLRAYALELAHRAARIRDELSESHDSDPSSRRLSKRVETLNELTA